MNKEQNTKNKDLTANFGNTVLSEVEIKELQESEENGRNWFNAYQDIDGFLFEELDKRGLSFITRFENPSLNTIESIKLLCKNFR